MKLEVPVLPDKYEDFATEVAKLARNYGIEEFNMEIKPCFEDRMEQDLDLNGKIRILYSGVDGRCRPANNLRIEMETKLVHRVSSTTPSHD